MVIIAVIFVLADCGRFFYDDEAVEIEVPLQMDLAFEDQDPGSGHVAGDMDMIGALSYIGDLGSGRGTPDAGVWDRSWGGESSGARIGAARWAGAGGGSNTILTLWRAGERRGNLVIEIGDHLVNVHVITGSFNAGGQRAGRIAVSLDEIFLVGAQ